LIVSAFIALPFSLFVGFPLAIVALWLEAFVNFFGVNFALPNLQFSGYLVFYIGSFWTMFCLVSGVETGQELERERSESVLEKIEDRGYITGFGEAMEGKTPKSKTWSGGMHPLNEHWGLVQGLYEEQYLLDEDDVGLFLKALSDSGFRPQNDFDRSKYYT
jgi:hypothetical protein